MKGDWRKVTLGEISEIFDGPYATPKKTDSGPVFLGISNLANGRIEHSTTQHLSAEFICQMLNTQAMHDTVSGYATGTTVNMVPVEALYIPGTVLPPPQLVATLSTIVETTRFRQEELIEESRALAAQRDALLPRLESGEMRVGEPTALLAVLPK